MNLGWLMIKDIKNFIEDIVLDIYNKLFSSKYVLKGKCKKCGYCCKNILFSTKDGYVKDKKIFQQMQKKYTYYRHFKISGVIKDDNEIRNNALTFECKFLSKNNKCLIYLIRPMYCRDYPNVMPEFIYGGLKPLKECGYYFDINKKFSEYLQ